MSLNKTHILGRLSAPDLTVKEQDSIRSAISAQTNIIWRYICNTYNKKLDWWAFQNDVDLGSGNGSTGGYFDPSTDSEFVTIIGNYKRTYDDFPYDDGFDTDLLWTKDWMTEINATVSAWKAQQAKEKAAAKAAKAAREAEKKKLIAQVKAKLTKEELKVIKWR